MFACGPAVDGEFEENSEALVRGDGDAPGGGDTTTGLIIGCPVTDDGSDTFACAALINATPSWQGETIVYNLHAKTDQDFFRFRVAANRTYRVRFETIAAPWSPILDTRCEYRDTSNLTSVASDDTTAGASCFVAFNLAPDRLVRDLTFMVTSTTKGRAMQGANLTGHYKMKFTLTGVGGPEPVQLPPADQIDGGW